MARWKPDALPRLQQAAMELFLERGYDKTTVADIAERAELTERTFFRYFTDKKEVMFAGTHLFENFVYEAVRSSSAADPLERVIGAFEASAKDYFDDRADFARRRRLIIQSNDELFERELKKLVRMADNISAVLIEQEVSPDRARSVAEIGLLVFRIAFDRWAESVGGSLADQLRAVIQELHQISDSLRRS